MQTAISTMSDRGNDATTAQLPTEHAQYLTFWLGAELFAVGILGIKEILQFGQLTTVPLMPAHIRGVINLRGAVVPVIDLQARFGRGAAQAGKRTCIVIIEVVHEGERHDMGIMVDAVSAVIDIGPGQIEPVPAFGASVRNDFIAGMGKLDDRFVIILDVARTFSFGELSAIHDAGGGMAYDRITG